VTVRREEVQRKDALHDLSGRTCLVTGAAGNIGTAIAEMFGRAGARLLLTDVAPGAAEDVAAKLRKEGIDALGADHDVGDESAWQRMIDLVVDRWRSLEILINNAAISNAGSTFAEARLEDWRAVMAVNCDGTFLGIKHAIPAMLKGRGGSIVNMSSIAANVGLPSIGSYCASKGAVAAMTRAAAIECGALRPQIRVNALLPGQVDSEKFAARTAQERERLILSYPIGRVAAPEEIAAAALFLASDASSFMTGSEMVVDGGFTAT